jgi:ATP-dependent Clp protease ATP-binding subunit ClpB
MNRAQTLARDHGNQHVEGEHLLLALLEDPEGMAPSARQEGRRRRRPLSRGAEAPRHRPAQGLRWRRGSLYAGESLRTLFDEGREGREEARGRVRLREHFLIAAPELGGGKAQDVLTRNGLNKDVMLAALKDVRGNQRMVEEDPDAKFKALDKYCDRSHPAGPGRQARPGHRPGRGDPPHDAGPVHAPEEQPGAHR